ncbi:MAG: DUF2207 domain-containing protein [Candidatus Methanoplasma sp.]|jgi:uncharacterized membrane protein|nr:DUF2207 domain-containing protein [Candidatus Methanoplasma sp.]
MRIAGVAVLVVFFGFFSMIFLAAFFLEDEYGFDHYRTDIDIEVRGDGSIAVTETYQFRWSEVSSGEMYIWFADEKAGNVNLSSVKCSIDGRNAALVSYSAGNEATYTGADDMALYSYGRNYLSGDWEINAFYKRAVSGEHTVAFQYEVLNAVYRYADCADFYYIVFSSFAHDLHDLTVTVSMPAGSAQDSVYIFGHGDPNARCEFADGTADAVFTSSRLDAYTRFEIRAVDRNTSLYTISPIRTDKNFESILKEEKRFQDETEMAIMLGYAQICICLGALSAAVLLTLLRNRIFERNRPNFNHPYTRELPDVKPNIAAGLGDFYKLKGGKFSDKVSATILDLAVQNVISIEEGRGKEIMFVSINEQAEMTKFERNIYNMIFHTVKGGGEKRIALDQLKKAVESSPMDHIRLFDIDREEFDAGGYVDRRLEERNSRLKPLPVIFFPVLFSIIAISIYIDYFLFVPIGFFTMFVCIVLTSISIGRASKPLTVRGEDEHAKARALKKFYTDMTLMKERRAMEISLWEKHLVYATALGVADKVAKELNIRLTEIGAPDPRLMTFGYIYTMHNAGGLTKGLDTIGKVSNAAFVRSAVSGGGGGGGYSGGGGGGFSGGGGGGFGGGGGGHR